jgi:urate oxidase
MYEEDEYNTISTEEFLKKLNKSFVKMFKVFKKPRKNGQIGIFSGFPLFKEDNPQ